MNRPSPWPSNTCGQHRSVYFAERLTRSLCERGVFACVDVWLRLTGEDHVIQPWLVPEGAWHEIGNPERLARVRAKLGE